MHKVKSMFLTILYMGAILGLGYLLIMESGQKVLENGIMLEETDYESSSSNIFYGKIEEDIELFPWNYYPGDEAELSWETESGIHPMFQYSILAGDSDFAEEELKPLQSWYLCQMIAYKTGSDPEEIWDIFDKKQHTLMDEICMVENSPIGALFFYQDTLPIGGKRYQVRVSFTQWNIINFVCMEERLQESRIGSQENAKSQAVSISQKGAGSPTNAPSQDKAKGRPASSFQEGIGSQEGGEAQKSIISQGSSGTQKSISSSQKGDDSQAAWKEGKEELVKILEESEGQMAEFFAYMSFLRDWDDTVFYVGELEEYSNCYLKGLQWLDRIQKGSAEKDQELSYILGRMEEIKSIENSTIDSEDAIDYEAKDAESGLGEESTEMEEEAGTGAAAGEAEKAEVNLSVEQEAEPSPTFSYQIVDLRDMILLLMQGESTIGIFYDPIAQEFCGYNFFYEY